MCMYKSIRTTLNECYLISEKNRYTCTYLIMLVQLDSSEINSPHNNGILSRCSLHPLHRLVPQTSSGAR